MKISSNRAPLKWWLAWAASSRGSQRSSRASARSSCCGWKCSWWTRRTRKVASQAQWPQQKVQVTMSPLPRLLRESMAGDIRKWREALLTAAMPSVATVLVGLSEVTVLVSMFFAVALLWFAFFGYGLQRGLSRPWYLLLPPCWPKNKGSPSSWCAQPMTLSDLSWGPHTYIRWGIFSCVHVPFFINSQHSSHSLQLPCKNVTSPG